MAVVKTAMKKRKKRCLMNLRTCLNFQINKMKNKNMTTINQLRYLILINAANAIKLLRKMKNNASINSVYPKINICKKINFNRNLKKKYININLYDPLIKKNKVLEYDKYKVIVVFVLHSIFLKNKKLMNYIKNNKKIVLNITS